MQFMTGGVAHYKCPEMRGLDDHFGDISSKISGECEVQQL